MTWAPDYKVEFDRRGRLLERLRNDPQLRADFMQHYKYNPVDWINDWCVTFDPRVMPPLPRLMPFLLMPRQKTFILFLYAVFLARMHGLVEKTRDVGLTWLCVCFSVWLWVFWSGSVIGWGSRKEEYVDKKGDPKAIFPKIRQLIEHLPRWMLPAAYDNTFMKIVNADNDSAITGEAGDNIGRGGRTSIYFKDESAHYEHPEMVEAALGDNTDVQIDISSVNGSANVFYRRRMAGEVWEPGKVMPTDRVWVFIFDWREDPRKTQDWYDRRRTMAEREGLSHIFAQEVDRDYAASVEGIIIRPEWVRASFDAHIRLAHLGNWFAGEKIAMNDIADGGGDRNAYASRHGSVLQRIEAWGGEAGDAARHGVPLASEDGVTEYYYDSIGVGAGFKTEANTMQKEPNWPARLRVLPWTASASPLDPTDHIIPGDDQSPTNEDQYLNLKGQSWFRLRARFWKTYLAVTRKQVFPVDELISLPANLPGVQELAMELSQAVKKTSTNGKTFVDKLGEGQRSPNMADAVVGAFNPTREVSILDVL